MRDFPPNRRWTIYSVQKTLPFLGQLGSVLGAHNYLALVRPDGEIELELQGVYTDGFAFNGPDPGDYLKVQMHDPHHYMADQSILSAQIVFSGSENEMRSLLQTSFDEVAKALDEKHMLYDGVELFGHAVNSNSIWFTALKAMGVDDPSLFDGPGSTPGNSVDLRTEPSNNEWINTEEDPWKPNPSFYDRFPRNQSFIDEEPAERNVTIEEDLMRRLLREVEAVLDPDPELDEEFS